jgi:hypothetical protein
MSITERGLGDSLRGFLKSLTDSVHLSGDDEVLGKCVQLRALVRARMSPAAARGSLVAWPSATAGCGSCEGPSSSPPWGWVVLGGEAADGAEPGPPAGRATSHY